MAKRVFSKDFLRYTLDLPYNKDIVLSNEIIENTRWSIIHSIVFKFEDKYYETSYSVGATEEQDEGPWEYDTEVECVEVRQVEKVVKVWEAV